ncbi:MAG: type III restriction-modification system subunit M [Candidatus Desulfovibrio kirbyi]|jgi:type I restriction enzyme M protein|uniref:site-specific DNA-methyltransferase (adenine-specific) n=1 Tax=Candidatus Desulfovibrio kirbyi TaxID=2696086 RepID=A0A6L2R4K1_9BACT|nr:MAG: type III restriction-modification system subunit M [Candidatus Desulfovibrio kirbyi]
MSEEEKRRLQQQLWNIADTLRGKMNADEFRDYILGFIFYKYLSEKIEQYADQQLENDNVTFADLDNSKQKDREYIEAVKDAAISELGYFLKPSDLFKSLVSKGNNKEGQKHDDSISVNFILEDLTKVLKSIEQSTLGTDSQDDFDQLFEDLDLTSTKLGRTEKDKNALVVRILTHLAEIDFNLANSNADVLGDAYEYLIGEFASGAGKKAGEFYTPQPVSTLLAKIIASHKQIIKTVYDPTCGSGSLLLRVKREVKKVDKIYGQEMNRTTYNLCRMNMILHDVHYDDFFISQEDTLERPQHRDLRFDAIVANPPFSAKWSANPLFLNDERFSVYGKLAPSSKADFAFIQHMVYQLAEDGIMSCVMPHGVLFRGGTEGHIRKFLIAEYNCLDAVIGLPANIFYATSIPTCVLVFKKCRQNPDSVLFIDASQHFEKVKTQNLLRPEHIQKIVDAYTARINEDKFSAVVQRSVIEKNSYNLNIPRYVDTFEKEEQIDLTAVSKKLTALEVEEKAVDLTIAGFCEELGILPPFGIQE